VAGGPCGCVHVIKIKIISKIPVNKHYTFKEEEQKWLTSKKLKLS
jgi:hypothetical protein